MDNKYGRVFTQADVAKILEWVEENTNSASDIDYDGIIEAMDEEGVRFKWEADEPLFILRGRDRRALGAIKHYMEHQSPQAPTNHINAIMAAFRSFSIYRDDHPGQMKDPD